MCCPVLDFIISQGKNQNKRSKDSPGSDRVALIKSRQRKYSGKHRASRQHPHPPAIKIGINLANWIVRSLILLYIFIFFIMISFRLIELVLLASPIRSFFFCWRPLPLFMLFCVRKQIVITIRREQMEQIRCVRARVARQSQRPAEDELTTRNEAKIIKYKEKYTKKK